MAKREALADVGGGNLEWPTLQRLAAKRFGELGDFLSRPGHNDKPGQLGQALGLAPLWKGGDVVGTDEIVQLGLGIAVRVFVQGVDGVRDAGAIQFLRVEFAPVFT